MYKESTAKIRRMADEIVSQIQLPRIPEKETVLALEEYSDIAVQVNEALAQCSAAGGGRVVIPSGRYRCGGSIMMQNFTELHLSEGCFIKFSPDPALYLPPVPTRWGGVEVINYSPMIYANGVTDTALTGRGVISGGRELWGSFKELQGPARTRSHSFQEEGIPVEERVLGEGCYMRPSMIQFRCCERVLVEDITCVDAPLWMLHPLFSSHVTVRRIYMDSMYVCNDGIDVDSCSDVLIEKSHFRNGDDAVVLKSGRDADGRRVNRPCARIVVRDCVFHDCMHGFAIGSELSGGAEDIFAYDIHMEYIWLQAISFKSCPGRGGVIKNIYVADIQVDKTDDHLISIVSEYESSDRLTGDERTLYTNFELLNIHCGYAKNGFILQGAETAPLEKILIANVTVDNAPVMCDKNEFTGTLEFRNVFMNGKEIKCSSF